MRLLVAGVLALVVVLAAAVGVNAAVTISLIGTRQRVWCPALEQLTSHPVPYPSDPAANPSRVESYRLYTEFVHIRDGLGC